MTLYLNVTQRRVTACVLPPVHSFLFGSTCAISGRFALYIGASTVAVVLVLFYCRYCYYWSYPDGIIEARLYVYLLLSFFQSFVMSLFFVRFLHFAVRCSSVTVPSTSRASILLFSPRVHRSVFFASSFNTRFSGLSVRTLCRRCRFGVVDVAVVLS